MPVEEWIGPVIGYLIGLGLLIWFLAECAILLSN